MSAVSSEESTERRILGAATALFSEQGYHATTMREVAAAVGIRAGSLYNHYESKQELLGRIASETMRELHEGAVRRLDGEDRPAAALRAFVEWHVVYHAERRLQAKVADEQLHALEPATRVGVVAIRDEYERLLEGILERGRAEEGWVVADTRVVGFAISTMCTAVDTWFREDGRLTASEVAGIYADLVLAAIGPRA